VLKAGAGLRCGQAATEAAAASAAAREREVTALRAQQERALDRRSELDELRARRCALLRQLTCTTEICVQGIVTPCFVPKGT
jgi:hypothetical protein